PAGNYPQGYRRLEGILIPGLRSSSISFSPRHPARFLLEKYFRAKVIVVTSFSSTQGAGLRGHPVAGMGNSGSWAPVTAPRRALSDRSWCLSGTAKVRSIYAGYFSLLSMRYSPMVPFGPQATGSVSCHLAGVAWNMPRLACSPSLYREF